MDWEKQTLEKVWQQLIVSANEQAQLITGIHATYTFTIEAEQEKHYTLVLQDGKATLEPSSTEEANCHITIGEKDFKKLVAGKLNATTAFMTGKLKVKGNITDALALERLLKQLATR